MKTEKRISDMSQSELSRLDDEMGLGEPGETYAETAARLRDAGDEEHADMYDEMEARWTADKCVYCGRSISDKEAVPTEDDDDGWEELAEEHAPDCEWILTRAHRQFRTCC